MRVRAPDALRDLREDVAAKVRDLVSGGTFGLGCEADSEEAGS